MNYNGALWLLKAKGYKIEKGIKVVKESEEMKIIVMADRSAGNDTVGEMWTDAYIFEKTATLEEVIKKVEPNVDFVDSIRTNITLQIARETNNE